MPVPKAASIAVEACICRREEKARSAASLSCDGLLTAGRRVGQSPSRKVPGVVRNATTHWVYRAEHRCMTNGQRSCLT